MGVKSLHRSVLAKASRANRKMMAPIKFITVAPQRKLKRQKKRDLWTLASRIVFITIAVLLVFCTYFDILRQSFKTGQFWNGIIVVVCLGLIMVWGVGLDLLRQIDMNRGVLHIPRQHQIGQSDIGDTMMQKIREARQHCASLFNNQMDFSEVEHAGLQNPLRRHTGDGGQGDIETPYWEFADSIPIFLEDNFTTIAPDFTIPASSSLRDYLARAINEKLLDSAVTTPTIQRFLSLYEQLRYSGGSLSHAEVIEMMEGLGLILNQIQQPDMLNNYSGSKLTWSETPRASQIFSTRPARAPSSSSVDSIRFYGMRPSAYTSSDRDSQISRDSMSSRVSGVFLRSRLRSRPSLPSSLLSALSRRRLPPSDREGDARFN